MRIRRRRRRSPRRSRTSSPPSRIAIIVYIALQDSLAGRTTVGEFASFLTAMLMLLAPLKHLTERQQPLQRGLAAAESVFGLIDAPAEEDTRHGRRSARARGEIALRERVASPIRRAREPALDGIDLDVRPGETVALVGASGGGKTTLVNLLPRFYRPSAARITARRPRPARRSRSRACAPTSRS